MEFVFQFSRQLSYLLITLYSFQKTGRASGLLHMWQCLAIFDPQIKGVQTSFCFGFEFKDYNCYLKAESAKIFNEWLAVLRNFPEKCNLMELPETLRRGTLDDTGGGRRVGSISATQTRNLSISTQVCCVCVFVCMWSTHTPSLLPLMNIL